MSRRLVTWIALFSLLGVLFAQPAMAGWSKDCPANSTCIINPSGTWGCPSGQEWRLRTYTDDFGPLDSQGTGQFTLTSGGTNFRKWRTGEWDQVTWTWWTDRTTMTYAEVKINEVSSVGNILFSVTCATRP